MIRSTRSLMLDDFTNTAELHGGIDTITVRTTTPVTFDKDKYPYIHGNASTDSKAKYYYYGVNPNQYHGKLIDSYSIYRKALKDCINDFPHDNGDITITRIDYRFDNYNDDFRDFLKVNVALMLMIGEQYKATNAAQSKHLRKPKDLNTFVKRAGFTIEYYDKEQERQSKQAVDPLDADIKSRLELRSRKLKFEQSFDVGYKTEKEYTEVYQWVRRFDKAIKPSTLQNLTAGLNNDLIEEYGDWKLRYGGGLRLSSFITEYRNYILTKPQLIDLYYQLGISNAETKVRDLLKTHPIEVLDYQNIETYTEKIIDTAEGFLIS